MKTAGSFRVPDHRGLRLSSVCAVLPALSVLLLFLSESVQGADRFELTLKSGNWEQLSIPFNSDTASLRNIFGDDLPASHYAKTWVAYVYNPVTLEYENPGLDGPVASGTGFWLVQISGTDIVIDVSSVDIAEHRPFAGTPGCRYLECTSVSLPAGSWGMVGVPFASPAAVSDLSATPCGSSLPCMLSNGGAAFHDHLFAYDSQADNYERLDDDALLNPMQGAWIKSRGVSNPSLLIPNTEMATACTVAFQKITPVSVDPQPHVTVASSSQTDIIQAIDRIKSAGGGTLRFPAGTFVIDRDVGARTHLYFEDMHTLKIVGAGKDSTRLVLAGNEAFKGHAVQTIAVEGYENLEISDLHMVGQKSFMNPAEVPTIGEERWAKANPESEAAMNYEMAEQQSAIFLRGGNLVADSSTYVHRMKFRHQGADAINLADVDNGVFSQLDIDDTGRNGITIGGVLGVEKSRNILIEDNDFGSGIDTQLIDIELHGSARKDPSGYELANLNVNVQVIGNRAERQLPEDTIDLDQYFMDIHGTNGVVLDSNDLGNNRLSGSYSHDVTIQNNRRIGAGRFFRTFDADMIGNEINLYPQTCVNCSRHDAGFTFTETNAEVFGSISLYGNVISSVGVQFPVRIHNATRASVVRNRFIIDEAGRDQIVAFETDMLATELNVFDNVGLNEAIQVQTQGYPVTRTREDLCH